MSSERDRSEKGRLPAFGRSGSDGFSGLYTQLPKSYIDLRPIFGPSKQLFTGFGTKTVTAKFPHGFQDSNFCRDFNDLETGSFFRNFGLTLAL